MVGPGDTNSSDGVALRTSTVTPPVGAAVDSVSVIGCSNPLPTPKERAENAMVPIVAAA